MNTTNDKLGTQSHGINNMSKATEKCQAFLFIFYFNQLIKRRTGAKSFFSCRSKNDNYCGRIMSSMLNSNSKIMQYFCRQRIALRMKEFNCCDSFMRFGLYVTTHKLRV